MLLLLLFGGVAAAVDVAVGLVVAAVAVVAVDAVDFARNNICSRKKFC